MKTNKDIQNHIDQLMDVAGKSENIVASAGFREELFSRFDRIDSQQKPKNASIFTLSEIQKYAAVILILVLNISAVIFYSSNSDDSQISEDISQYSEDYFPDYATLTSLD